MCSVLRLVSIKVSELCTYVSIVSKMYLQLPKNCTYLLHFISTDFAKCPANLATFVEFLVCCCGSVHQHIRLQEHTLQSVDALSLVNC